MHPCLNQGNPQAIIQAITFASFSLMPVYIASIQSGSRISNLRIRARNERDAREKLPYVLQGHCEVSILGLKRAGESDTAASAEERCRVHEHEKVTTTTLQLPRKLLEKLQNQAETSGLSLDLFILENLVQLCDTHPAQPPAPRPEDEQLVILLENPYAADSGLDFACLIGDLVHQVIPEGVEEFDIRAGDRVKVTVEPAKRDSRLVRLGRQLLIEHRHRARQGITRMTEGLTV